MEVNVGDRIRCIKMVDDPQPIESGDVGIVRFIDGIGQIHVDWDNGRKIALIPEVDKYEIIPSVNESKKVKDWKTFNQ